MKTAKIILCYVRDFFNGLYHSPFNNCKFVKHSDNVLVIVSLLNAVIMIIVQTNLGNQKSITYFVIFLLLFLLFFYFLYRTLPSLGLQRSNQCDPFNL